MSERVVLGRTGLCVSPVCFGTWQLSPRFWGPQPEEQVAAAMRCAGEVGVNFFDTADAYGEGLAEEVLGRALKGVPRDDLVIATKAFWHWHDDGSRYGDLSGKYLIQACENSLRRLQMEYIDLYQCHSWDALTDVDETIEALDTLKTQGKIRHYGVSNWSVEQLRLGHARGGSFATVQPVYSLLARGIETDLLPYCQAHNVGALVYSPLHRGLLSGKYRGDETFSDHRANVPDFQGERFKALCERVQKLAPIAQDYGCSILQLVVAATVQHPAIPVAIVGIKTAEQIVEAAQAMGTRLSAQDWHRVRAILDGA